MGLDNLKEIADKLLAKVLQEEDSSSSKKRKLFRLASPKLFQDEVYVIYSVLYTFKEKNININDEFLTAFLTSNKKLILNSKKSLDISAYGDIDGDEFSAYVAGVVDYFKRLKSLTVNEDFDLLFERYLIDFKRVELNKALRDSNMILTDSLKVGNKILSGYEDSVAYFKKRSAEIDGLVDLNNGKGFRTAQEVLDEKSDTGKSKKVSDFHKVDELNAHLGGIYAPMMYLVLGPPKAGKTKFCTRAVHTALVKYKQNVSIWPVEGGSTAFLAQMRAIHFDYLYNDGVDITQRKSGVSQWSILKNSLDSELATLEESSCLDLLNNPAYGKMNFIDRPFYIETCLEEIDTSIRENASSLLMIDYPQLVTSMDSKMSERERIANFFPKTLRYIKDNNIAAIFPAQYSQESVKEMLKSNDLSGVDTRVLGGGSSEMARTTDFLISLWGTTEDIKNHKACILPSTARFASVSDRIDLYIDGETCLFSSIKDK